MFVAQYFAKLLQPTLRWGGINDRAHEITSGCIYVFSLRAQLSSGIQLSQQFGPGSVRKRYPIV